MACQPGRTDVLVRYFQRRAHADPHGLMRICRGLASSGPPAGKALVLAICAVLGADVDPATVWANGTIHHPPEHL